MGVCVTEDDFVKHKLRWVAGLSDGSRVFQDDDREGETEPVAWKRLKKYIDDNDLEIRRYQPHMRGGAVPVKVASERGLGSAPESRAGSSLGPKYAHGQP